MNRIKQWIAERLGVQLEPNHVQKASLYERVKRGIWLVTAPFAAFLIMGVIAIVSAEIFVNLLPPKEAATLPFVLLFWAYANVKIFGWGVERFDLVPPWQFREAQDD